MSVHTSTFDAVFGNDPLGRFTAAIVTSVPEFDPGDTPIGHALATEFFQRVEAGDVEQVESAERVEQVEPAEVGEVGEVGEITELVEVVEPVTEIIPAVLAPEQVYEWPVAEEPARRPSPRPRVAPAPAVAEIAHVLDEFEAEEYEYEPVEEITGTVLELPVGGAAVEWFGEPGMPDEEIEPRRAS
ncbi:hypothetical protein ACQEVB_08565 [Pseudonocardia sp. CA-107938]|uniref:hypothetical protein n=1 Tax=Pseudonocardia sp. CA-107938 TaxID=3240021 RepID=UPI003D94968C